MPNGQKSDFIMEGQRRNARLRTRRSRVTRVELEPFYECVNIGKTSVEPILSSRVPEMIKSLTYERVERV